MQQKISLLKENEKKFLLCILTNGNLTDTEIAKRININKSTCSRIRKKLGKDIISDYIPIIELDKVGVDIFVVLTFQWKGFNNKEKTKKFLSDLKKDYHTIFLANGESSTMSTVIFLGFRNIEEYHEYFKKLRDRFDKFISNVNSLILPSKEVIKNDFTDIIKHILKNKNGK